jgi:hypothetical protein
MVGLQVDVVAHVPVGTGEPQEETALAERLEVLVQRRDAHPLPGAPQPVEDLIRREVLATALEELQHGPARRRRTQSAPAQRPRGVGRVLLSLAVCRPRRRAAFAPGA